MGCEGVGDICSLVYLNALLTDTHQQTLEQVHTHETQGKLGEIQAQTVCYIPSHKSQHTILVTSTQNLANFG